MGNDMNKEELRNAALDYIKNGGKLPGKTEIDAYGRFVFTAQALRELFQTTDTNKELLRQDKIRLDSTVKWIKVIGAVVLVLVVMHAPQIAQEADTLVKWILALL
jgi:hypothetical protein